MEKVIKEITLKVSQNDHLITQGQANEWDLEKRILKLHRTYAVIHRINEMIVKVKDKDKLFEEACKIAVESGKFRLVWIGLVDEINKIIKPYMWNGLGIEFLEEIKNMSVEDLFLKDPIQKEILNGNYFVCNNIEKESGFILRENGLKHGFHSLISMPLMIRNKVKGSFNIYADEQGFFNEDEIKLLQEVSNDISFSLESITKEEDLKTSEKVNTMFAQSLRSINEFVSITDMNNNILFVNQLYLKTYGYDENELIGKHVSLVISPLNPLNLAEEIFSATRSGGWKGELWNKRKDGSEFPVSLSTSVIYDEDGTPLGLIGVANDITERKRAEHDLIEARDCAESANRLKDAFIANISHEIRTPLNGILGMASLIREIIPGNIREEDEVLFEGIAYSSQRIIRTVDMILNYSRLQAGVFPLFPKRIMLSSICKKLATEFTIHANNKLLELKFQNNCGDLEIFADEYSITMAISNLLDNAVKYTYAGFIYVTLLRGDNDNLILYIKDSGIGIDKDYLEKIFEPYQQAQMGYGRAYEGIGLGLALVKKVLTLNNVNISVSSKKGNGTTFSINFGKALLPVTKIVGSVIKGNPPSVPELKENYLVLIVEDDRLNQLTIKKFLEKRYTTLFTDSSDEVLEILIKNKVDLILMDISIFGKLDGLELTKVLKGSKEYSHIPIIAVTAHAFEEDKQIALEAGCDNYLTKPFSKASLLDMISNFVAKPDPEKSSLL